MIWYWIVLICYAVYVARVLLMIYVSDTQYGDKTKFADKTLWCIPFIAELWAFVCFIYYKTKKIIKKEKHS